MDVQSDAQHTPGTAVPSSPDSEATNATEDLAVADWLLTATESRARSRMEWQEVGVTMLQTGRAFSAVRMSARLIRAAACTSEAAEVDDYLARALLGGPVICDPHRHWYYALVPAGESRRWEATRDVELFGVGSYVGVPRPGLAGARSGGRRPYWSVPMGSASDSALCVPAVVAALVDLGLHELAGR